MRSTVTTVAEVLADHTVADHEFGSDLIESTRGLLLDYLAIAAAGSTRDSATAARSALPTWSTGPGARIEGVGLRASAQDAALINGISSHGLEIDDTHEESSSHPGVAIWPALLAVADTEASQAFTVRDLLEAGVVGYDVMCSAGVLLGAAESYGRGFHPTGVAGIIGAASAVARLLGLTQEQARNAIGLACNMASGSLEFLADGSWTKRLNAGAAASGGVRAAFLARAGFTAPATSFEGRDGWLAQYGHGASDSRRLELELGRGSTSTSIKLYPCCRYMHGVMDLLIDVHRQHPELRPDDVETIQVGVIQAGQSLVSVPHERKLVINTPVDAQFSMPFGAALALTTGAAPLAEFDRAPEVASGLGTWMSKVESIVDPRVEAAYPASWEASVHLRLRDGTQIDKYTLAYRGSPADPALWPDLVSKAEGLIGGEAFLVAARLLESNDLPVGEIHRAVPAGQ